MAGVPPTAGDGNTNQHDPTYNVHSQAVVNEETPLIQTQSSTSERIAPQYEQEAWNDPKMNINRFLSTLLSFTIMGMNDSCIGPLIPYMLPYYDISYTAVSLLFVTPTAGYLVAALVNNTVHNAVGQRGIAIAGSICRLVAYVPLALHPAFPVLPVVMTLSGLGNGLNDSAWNAWVGGLRNTNELLGLLHGTYGAGGIIAPLIATAMITKLNLPWYAFYYVMIVLSVVELLVSVSSFWTATGAAHRSKHKLDDGREPATTKEILQLPVVWIAALFIFAYVGVEVSLGAWATTFMLRIRHANGFIAGITATLFWTGLTLGRIILGFITGRIGEKLAIMMYLTLCIALQLMYWLVPDLITSIVSVVFLGFFLGPLFPAMIVTLAKLLPADRHVASIGMTSAIGGGGAAFIPFVAGGLAEKYGVQVLQPFVLVMLVLVSFIWLSFPGGFKKGGLERAQREGFTIFGGLRKLFSAESH